MWWVIGVLCAVVLVLVVAAFAGLAYLIRNHDGG
jgi:hypothetical protein